MIPKVFNTRDDGLTLSDMFPDEISVSFIEFREDIIEKKDDFFFLSELFYKLCFEKEES